MKTFVYRGDAERLRVRVGDMKIELTKGEPLSTEDKKVIRQLSIIRDVEEVNVSDKKEEPTKPSRKPDALKP